MDRWQYMITLAACLLITAPLELFGNGVYRQARRAAAAIVPVALVFLVWDAIAVQANLWWYNPKYILGVRFPGDLPLEEVLFFVVIPLCGLLTYSAVGSSLKWFKSRRTGVGDR